MRFKSAGGYSDLEQKEVRGFTMSLKAKENISKAVSESNSNRSISSPQKSADMGVYFGHPFLPDKMEVIK